MKTISRKYVKRLKSSRTGKDNYKRSGEAAESLKPLKAHPVSDPESRQIMIRNNITEVAYNVQSTVDSKHCIPIDYKVTNENDCVFL